jgi:hypothetical protein
MLKLHCLPKYRGMWQKRDWFRGFIFLYFYIFFFQLTWADRLRRLFWSPAVNHPSAFLTFYPFLSSHFNQTLHKFSFGCLKFIQMKENTVLQGGIFSVFFSVLLLPRAGVLPFIWSILNPLSLRMICAKSS